MSGEVFCVSDSIEDCMALYLKKELEETRTIVGVWQITETEEELRALASVPADETEEISFIANESLRKQRLAVRALLCELFGEKVYLSHHDNGKPYLENSVTNISITHTGKYVAVILDDNEDVGIDIESLPLSRRRRCPMTRSKILTTTGRMSSWQSTGAPRRPSTRECRRTAWILRNR